VAIYLGLDSSTQSVTATAIEVDGDRRTILFERTFRYDDELPHYGTKHGVLSSRDPKVVHAPPLMWSEALDRMIATLVRETTIDWSTLRAISGSAQQHGSVYVNADATKRLEQLTPSTPLAAQLEGVFSRKTSPIWMDSSTTSQCAAIEAAVGGPRRLAQITGSRAFERFTGPQIRKFAEEDPAGYAATDRVHLVSSWLASLLAGTHAPIDPGDGSGMNLMELATRQWSADAVRATAPNLDAKLPPVAEAWTITGTLAPYWTQTYNLPPARVVAWSGDNPCSLVGTGLVREGLVAISLGTSDTIFGIMPTPRPSDDGTGHVFASPTGSYMGMTVFKNGSLARERVRDEYRMDWKAFSQALGQTAAGNGGKTLLPWFDPEITPLVLNPGVRRYGLEPEDSEANVRAIVEAQMMALALHSQWMGVRIGTIYATGGASANRDMLQVMADVFDAEVFQLQTGNSAALGAALRAFHADRLADGEAIAWDDVVKGFVAPKTDSRLTPNRANVEVYRRLIDVYRERERSALEANA
jgi:xylulokinase